ncbi:hypothetical protein CYLTODRAFT_256956 [Cylindrobasidium torrendii FP15055 ss-10]|uniref:Uncharacterized protein n=1 Tax=Cylindrobasidium torrendii FP15055 ss-10 TaxID=1314674 RepID=A0A0D7BUG3_9AGAR|nr:hypothetical protein CYLTODRAFT_256956 [Cylindrobasidium torrendii FP15055 ss-10]
MDTPMDVDDDVEFSICELTRRLKLLRRMDQHWDTVPKTLAVYPFITDLVYNTWKDYRRCLNMAFCLPVDPCCISSPVDRFHKPYSRVDAMVTTEISIPPQWPAIDVSPTSSSWVRLSSSDGDGGSGSERTSTEHSGDRDSDNSAHTTDDDESDWVMGSSGDESVRMDGRSQEEEADANEASQTESEEEYDSGLLHNTVFQHLHLVVPQSKGILDFALFCIATPSNAFHVMASSLLQRRALGVVRTLPILVFDTYTTSVQLVFGWTTTADGGSCVDIHVARATAATGSTANPTGIFDLASPLEARSFARSLSRLCSATALAAHEATNSVKDILANQPGDILQWRLDCAGHSEQDPSGTKLRDRVECWLSAVGAAELDATGKAGMMASNDASSMDNSASSHGIPPCHRTPTSSFLSSHCTDTFVSEDMTGASSSKQPSITPSDRKTLQLFSASGSLQWQFANSK